MANHALWWSGPEWLSEKTCWPPDIVTNATQESLAEAKAKRDMLAVAVAAADELDDLLEKFTQWKAIRVTAWIIRFTQNSRTKNTERLGRPLTANETKKAEVFWVKRVQGRATADGRYQEDKLQLNLQQNRMEYWNAEAECRATTRYSYQMDNDTLRSWWPRPMLQRFTGE